MVLRWIGRRLAVLAVDPVRSWSPFGTRRPNQSSGKSRKVGLFLYSEMENLRPQRRRSRAAWFRAFRTFKCTEIALYHAMGYLPELPTTHRFC